VEKQWVKLFSGESENTLYIPPTCLNKIENVFVRNRKNIKIFTINNST